MNYLKNTPLDALGLPEPGLAVITGYYGAISTPWRESRKKKDGK